MSVLAHTRDIIRELGKNTGYLQEEQMQRLTAAVLEAKHILRPEREGADLPCGLFPCG